MNLDHELLISKYSSKKVFMAVIMFVQSVSAAEQAFLDFERTRDDNGISPPSKVLKALAYARFFCEACGWCSLAMRRLRQDNEKIFNDFLKRNEKHIESLYKLRTEVNHKYNEDLIDAYRNSNYKAERHQAMVAFNFGIIPGGPGFRIGILEVSMVSQLASMKKLETELLELN